ncbi:hypothetical protein MNBD_GAMMA26-2501 [hydrothermal vent metagenome]|uniref:bAvd-like domain-containing protein n=1 Tax=hydrothermal vent metagenome TaxID=652676 RepID=A0A3B1B5H9_9ZZZZ
MTDGAFQGGPALEAMFRFQLWLIPTIEKFPRSQKFLLGDRIQSTALDVLESLIEATYTKKRLRILQTANLTIEKLRVLFRLAKELRYLNPKRYEYAVKQLFEIGSLVGGWMKNVGRGLPRLRSLTKQYCFGLLPLSDCQT